MKNLFALSHAAFNFSASSNLYDECSKLKNSMTFGSDPRALPCGVDCKADTNNGGEVASGKMQRIHTIEAMSQYEFVHLLYFLADEKVKAQDNCEVEANSVKISNRCIQIKTFVCDQISECSSSDQELSRFWSVKACFTASHYLKRIYKYSDCSPSCIITAMIYLENLQRRFPSMLLNSRTFRRLLLVAVMTATKFLEDSTWLNSHWCKSFVSFLIMPCPTLWFRDLQGQNRGDQRR